MHLLTLAILLITLSVGRCRQYDFYELNGKALIQPPVAVTSLGGNVSLTCERANPPGVRTLQAVYRWTRGDGQGLLPKVNFVHGTRGQHLTVVGSPTASGQYSCEVTALYAIDGEGGPSMTVATARGTALVAVASPPTASAALRRANNNSAISVWSNNDPMKPAIVIIPEGGNTSLSCEIPANSRVRVLRATYHWSRQDGQNFLANLTIVHGSHGQHLMIHGDAATAGKYACQVTFLYIVDGAYASGIKMDQVTGTALVGVTRAAEEHVTAEALTYAASPADDITIPTPLRPGNIESASGHGDIDNATSGFLSSPSWINGQRVNNSFLLLSWWSTDKKTISRFEIEIILTSGAKENISLPGKRLSYALNLTALPGTLKSVQLCGVFSHGPRATPSPCSATPPQHRRCLRSHAVTHRDIQKVLKKTQNEDQTMATLFLSIRVNSGLKVSNSIQGKRGLKRSLLRQIWNRMNSEQCSVEPMTQKARKELTRLCTLKCPHNDVSITSCTVQPRFEAAIPISSSLPFRSLRHCLEKALVFETFDKTIITEKLLLYDVHAPEHIESVVTVSDNQ